MQVEEIIEIQEIKPPTQWQKFRTGFFVKLDRIKKWWRSLGKLQKFGLSVGLILIILVLGSGLIWIIRPRELSKPAISGDNASFSLLKPQLPKDYESPLDGILVTKTEYEKMMEHLPLAVIIENHSSARPQSGINKADLVYEALAEGGITRLLVIYFRQEAPEIGPIRSTRSYFQDWVAEYNAIYMHIGGAASSNPDADALGQILRYGIKSLNRGGTFWRKLEKEAPHNAYSSTERLWDIATNLGWNGPGEIDKWQFKEDEDQKDRPKESEIKFNWGGWDFNSYSIRWLYDQRNNVYLREVGGEKDADASFHEQTFAKNLILQFSKQTLANDGTARILYQTIGGGRALIFLDGRVIEGMWKKSERTARTKFYDSKDNEISFNRGVSWIEVVPTDSEIEYK